MAVALLGSSRQTKKLVMPNEMWTIATYNRDYKSAFITSCKLILLFNDTTYLVMINHYHKVLVGIYAKSHSC